MKIIIVFFKAKVPFLPSGLNSAYKNTPGDLLLRRAAEYGLPMGRFDRIQLLLFVENT